LRRLKTEYSICLLTFNDKGRLDEFSEKFQVIDLGWVNDLNLMTNALNAADIFLMPSVAEAFGMMAMEAMACGKPVIVFEGTSLPEIVFAPEGGIAVTKGDVDALFVALELLINNPEKRKMLGDSALKIAKHHYDINSHIAKMLELYTEVIARRKVKC
jgi:glycosyltransferase involved in cell wall biosynthesis